MFVSPYPSWNSIVEPRFSNCTIDYVIVNRAEQVYLFSLEHQYLQYFGFPRRLYPPGIRFHGQVHALLDAAGLPALALGAPGLRRLRAAHAAEAATAAFIVTVPCSLVPDGWRICC